MRPPPVVGLQSRPPDREVIGSGLAAELVAVMDRVRRFDGTFNGAIQAQALVSTIDGLGRQGVQFRSISDPVGTTSASGRLIFAVFAAIAAFERELMVEQTLTGLAAGEARGVQLGRKTRVNPTQFQRIHILSASGHSQAKIGGRARPRREIASIAGQVPHSDNTELAYYPAEIV